MEVRLDYKKLILDENKNNVVRENKLKTLYLNYNKNNTDQGITLSHSKFQPVGHGYLNCLLSCFCFISPDFGLPTQVESGAFAQCRII